MESIISFGMALLAAPLFPGIILKVKAFWAGKKGPPLLIKYYTFFKLLRKGSVYSTSTSLDRKSTRLNSSHLGISYAVFCLKNKS